MKMLRAIDVWRRLDDQTAVCYRCFEVLNGSGFCVQSKDYYHLPANAKQKQYFQSQFLELLCEEPPESRSGVFPSLQEAIRAFDEDFEEGTEQKGTIMMKQEAISVIAVPLEEPKRTKRREVAKKEEHVSAQTARR
jgi:hypothetical protein